jgi:beta-sarcoglycan
LIVHRQKKKKTLKKHISSKVSTEKINYFAPCEFICAAQTQLKHLRRHWFIRRERRPAHASRRLPVSNRPSRQPHIYTTNRGKFVTITPPPTRLIRSRMVDYRSTSPTSDIFSDEVDSISIRDKALLKRSVSKHHNNNFKAGYVPVHEQHLTKTGLRGRKTFAFWTLVALLFILAVGNLLLTITILGVLRLGQGMESIELVPEEYAVKFFGDTDLGHMYKRDGRIEGFKDQPVEISADESAILLNLMSLRNGRPSNQLRINKNGTSFWGFESFDVRNKHGAVIFSTNSPQFNSLTGANSLNAKNVFTNRIASPVHGKLKVEGRILSLKGSEGTRMDGKEIVWSADQDIYLKTNNGSIVLSGSDGTLIDVKRIPIATTRNNNYVTSQYKVCVCMPQGKLFRIPVPSGSNQRVFCHHINTSPTHNPCI